MQKENSLNAVLSFLKRCYEIGNRPINNLREVNLDSQQMAINAKKPRKKSTTIIGPTPGNFAVEGTISPGEKSQFAINGKDFEIGADTWVVGTIKPGSIARVSGVMKINGRHATRVLVMK